jgi:hypothetical protein
MKGSKPEHEFNSHRCTRILSLPLSRTRTVFGVPAGNLAPVCLWQTLASVSGCRAFHSKLPSVPTGRLSIAIPHAGALKLKK